MILDLNKMREIAESLYVPVIARAHGREGVSALKDVLSSLHRIYSYVEPELIKGTFLVFKRLQGDDPLHELPVPKTVSGPEHLLGALTQTEPASVALIQLQFNGTFLLWKGILPDLRKLSTQGIVYRYRQSREFFVTADKEHEIMNPSRVHASIFAIPTFKELRDALEDYKERSIKTSRCRIFAEAWDRGAEGPRLFFRKAPESSMRRSLTQYLQNVLRDAEVRPEQVVDESHPVDIKVTWMLTNRQALIEIKWLGKSISSKAKFTVHSDARAREGAQQLAKYLDRNRTEAPTHQAVGYLIVIDGRRRGLRPTASTINYENGMYYRDREIVFTTDYHAQRSDFAEPFRMFAEPICSPN
jgi:hypothetical protein